MPDADARSPLPRRRLIGLSVAIVLALVFGLLAASAEAAKLRSDDLKITTTPDLYPAFDPSAISRYVVRCEGKRTRIEVVAQHGTKVGIDGHRRRSGRFHAGIPLYPGAATVVRARNGDGHGRYVIRCLPQDFPEYTFKRLGGPTPRWELMTVGSYAVIFDRNGVPAWWLSSPRGVNDGKLLPDGNLAWWTNGTVGPFGSDPAAVYQEFGLDGSVKNTIRAVGLNTDLHDMQQLPNGDHLVLSYSHRSHVDLSAYGQGSDATVLDAVIQRVDPDGNVVWSWNSKDHIGLDETGRWWSALHAPFYDILHINSVERAGDSLIVSFRHADAVYSIDRSTGDINWKLGGTHTPESLEVKNDPNGDYPLGGQHDARFDKRGNLTVFDDETDPACGGRPPAPKCARSPRAVEFKIDENAGTATLVKALSDPKVDSTWCCGGARKTRNRGWIVAWGGTAKATGFAPDGAITQRYDFTPGLRVDQAIYRIVPLSKHDFTSARLRRAMDRAHPPAAWPLPK
jgi:hypothetical protein